MEKQTLNYASTSKFFLSLTIIVGIIYFAWWLDFSHVGNIPLYGLLLFGEAYHITMALTFWMTIWPHNTKGLPILPLHEEPFSVAIFIPVVSEPEFIIRQTIVAAKHIQYERKKVYVLNDAFVARRDNWQDIERLCQDLGVECITRKKPGGAKAGNINHALSVTTEEIIVIFDADMQAKPTFLAKTIPYFVDPRVAFVQTPQFYSNSDTNAVTEGSWEQQNFFFGPIMIGKNNYNAAFICGTNVAIRRTALHEVGGMCEDNIAEDFLTSILIHKRKWKSVYVPEVLATGLAPLDLLSYYKQQLRWTRGSLEVLFTHNPLFQRGLTFAQRIQYLSSALYYFNGVIIFIDMLVPIIFLLFGVQPVSTSTTSFAVFFVPYMFLSLYAIYLVSDSSITFKAFSFSQASFSLQLVALWSIITRKKMSFAVTAKNKLEGNFLNLCYPHIAYILIACFAIGMGIQRDGLHPAVLANVAWVLFNMVLFLPFISVAGSWKRKTVIPQVRPAIS